MTPDEEQLQKLSWVCDLENMSEEKKKRRYLHVNSSPSAPFIVKRIPHCFALHTGNAFTEECFILLQISLVVWQKNGKRTDYVYFQKRAYQSVIRPLWCSHLYLQLMIRVISVRSPWMYCFPSRRGCLEYCLCVCICVCSVFQMIWMTLSNSKTIFGGEKKKSLHILTLGRK